MKITSKPTDIDALRALSTPPEPETDVSTTTPRVTRQQFREECARKGLPLASVAKRYGFNLNLFYEIVNDDDANPRRKCLRGESHSIAVTIGIKAGEVSRAAA